MAKPFYFLGLLKPPSRLSSHSIIIPFIAPAGVPIKTAIASDLANVNSENQ